MPVTPTYPGVYIEEVPSGVRTIMGVATSITAFIGRALRGPTDEPTTINSYAEFERVFGGLWIYSAMSYAVRDFFQNGGSQAIIIRLYNTDTSVGAQPAKAVVKLSNLNLQAVHPGAWGNELRVRVDNKVRPSVAGEDGTLLFNLYIRDGNTGAIEEFRNVSLESNHKRQVDKVLSNESKLVRITTSPLPTALPTLSGSTPVTPGNTVWDEDTTSTGVATADEASDGLILTSTEFTGIGKEAAKQGLYALEKADLFNLLCIPPYKSDDDVDPSVVTSAATYCEKRRAFLLVDPFAAWDEKADAIGDGSTTGVAAVGTSSKNAALFFPRLCMPNPLKDDQIEDFAPCGAVAGIFARTDTQRGVWKAPAGLEATLNGVPKLKVSLTDPEIGELNQIGVNCLKVMPGVGRLVWGSRTLQGSDRLASEWKYIPIRRLALFLEESLYRVTQWVVFEPNDEPLWSQIRLNVGAFMHNQFRKGAFQGSSPKDAYFVKCDGDTTTQNDRDQGIVNILVGFAPLKPAEFVIIKISQIAGQIET
jgi:phage tail sheath protein FI